MTKICLSYSCEDLHREYIIQFVGLNFDTPLS